MQPVPPLQPNKIASDCKRRRFRPYVALLILGLLLTGMGCWIYWPVSAPPLRIARGTTFLTGPVNPDGTINYTAALNAMLSEGVTSQNNAAIELLQVLGPEMIQGQARPAVLGQLGLADLPATGEYG
jgi:hypothetical protein